MTINAYESGHSFCLYPKHISDKRCYQVSIVDANGVRLVSFTTANDIDVVIVAGEI